jgi:hypothetical protein
VTAPKRDSAGAEIMPCVRPQDPRIAYVVDGWHADLRYEFEERAAIIQYEGGAARWVAEREAFEQTRKDKP